MRQVYEREALICAVWQYNRAIGKTIGPKQSDTIVVPTVRLSFDVIVQWDYHPNPTKDTLVTFTKIRENNLQATFIWYQSGCYITYCLGQSY